jgi:hypothetical protein
MAHSHTHHCLHFFHKLVDGMDDHFKRTRCWGPRSVWIALMILTRPSGQRSYAFMLQGVLSGAGALLGWSKAPSASSFSQARGKMTAGDCRAFVRHLITTLWSWQRARFRHHAPRRFIAIDGTRFICPRSRETLRKLDRPHAKPWLLSHYPQALVVVAFDVIRRLPLDWVLLPKGRGERAAMAPLISHFNRGDVVIMDRGFPARWLLALLTEKGIDVVMRMTAAKAGSWPEVVAFLKSGASTAVISCTIGKGRSVTVRLMRKNARLGRPKKHQSAPETMVIMTTLLPKDGFEKADIIDLYRQRWGIEIMFREMKEAFSMERFHARSMVGIEQEIAAVITWIALGAVLQDHIEDGLGDGRRVRGTLCRGAVEDLLLRAWRHDEVEKSLEIWNAMIRQYAYKPRPGRSFPRVSKRPAKRFGTGK